MRNLTIAACIGWALAAGAAQAETFTFVNTSSNPDQVMLPASTAGGRPSGVGLNHTTSAATFADGKKTEVGGRCSSWILPPGNQFGSNGVCDFRDASGPLYQSRFTCAAPTPGGKGVDCWGTLTGVGGAWKDRSGAFTAHTTPTGATGEGHWND